MEFLALVDNIALANLIIKVHFVQNVKKLAILLILNSELISSVLNAINISGCFAW